MRLDLFCGGAVTVVASGRLEVDGSRPADEPWWDGLLFLAGAWEELAMGLDRSLSRLMSLVLRHRPDQFGLELDPEGYVAIHDLVAALQSRRPNLTRADIEAVVADIDPVKQRFSIVEDHVRANYGHSVAGRVQHEAATPPDVLLHGTNSRVVDRILGDGLRPMNRQYVHLTADLAVAQQVGGRRGEVVVLEVDAAGAHASGVTFRRANPTFWLADHVPARFLGRYGSDQSGE